MNGQWWNTGDDEFVRFYSADEYRIRGYILCLVGFYCHLDAVGHGVTKVGGCV